LSYGKFLSIADPTLLIPLRSLTVAARNGWFAGSLVVLTALSLHASFGPFGAKLSPVGRAHLCVTEGAVEEMPDHRLSVSVPKMRAYLNGLTAQAVEAEFIYLGATGNEARLGSGELRRQFGLKLRAQDACNLVYAMWRIEPESKLVVSVKSNPDQHTSAECGNRGDRNIKPAHGKPVPALRPGSAHTLRAEMNGAEMRVFADNALVWEGSVGAEALSFDGPIGMRSDNARLQLEFRAGQPLRSGAGREAGCRSGPGESE
jgi:hypothetical protein